MTEGVASRDALVAAFRVFDSNGDGSVSTDELKAILTRSVAGQPPQMTEAEVDRLIAMFDVNGDGVLSIDEVRCRCASLLCVADPCSL